MNCSNQELHVIRIILQINDSPRKREDVPWRLLDSPGQSGVLGSALGAAKEALLSLKTRSRQAEGQHRFKRPRFCAL